MNDFKEQALALTKARLGISTTVRDTLLQANINAIVDELTNEQGLTLQADSPAHLMFVVDYATWRYQSVNSTEVVFTQHTLPMPRYLQFRLHNLIIAGGGKNE